MEFILKKKMSNGWIQYKPGDKVGIINLSEMKRLSIPTAQIPEATGYAGKIAVVTEVYNDIDTMEEKYRLDIDSGLIGWPTELLIPYKVPNRLYALGDRAIIKNPKKDKSPYFKEASDKNNWYIYIRDASGCLIPGNSVDGGFRIAYINEEMMKYFGKAAIIGKTGYSIKSQGLEVESNMYKLNVDQGEWLWPIDMFEGSRQGGAYPRLIDALIGKPKGTRLYSPAYGLLKLYFIDGEEIITLDDDGELQTFRADGTLSKYGEPMLKLDI